MTDNVLTTILPFWDCTVFSDSYPSVLAANLAMHVILERSIHERFTRRKPMYDYDYDDEQTSGNGLELWTFI